MNSVREEIIKKEEMNFLQVYNRFPIVVEKANGCIITDLDGTDYLDFLGGIAVNVLGHSHPKIIRAIEEQSKKYLHLSNYFYQDSQINFVEKLTKLTGYSRTFLSNSGAESIEGIIKMARRWGYERNKDTIISFDGGFHGRTYGALSLMNKPLYKNRMGPFLGNCKTIPFNSIPDLMEAINTGVSAVVLEFIQGEGGISAVDREYVAILKELKERNNFLIIADEVQSGIGRTGNFFAFEQYDVSPDIVAVSKGLGGGLPLGAILVKEELSDIFGKSQHGTTFGGNALACATGLVVLEELESGLMENVRNTGEYFINKLKNIQNEFPSRILQVRGVGLMLGLVLSFESRKLVDELLKYKVIANATSGNVLRLVPPLIISENDVDTFCNALKSALNNLENTVKG